MRGARIDKQTREWLLEVLGDLDRAKASVDKAAAEHRARLGESIFTSGAEDAHARGGLEMVIEIAAAKLRAVLG